MQETCDRCDEKLVGSNYVITVPSGTYTICTTCHDTLTAGMVGHKVNPLDQCTKCNKMSQMLGGYMKNNKFYCSLCGLPK